MKHYLRFIPNLISLVRISLVIPIVLNLLAGKYIFALILFAIASISDAIDGFLARFFKWQTDLVKILDPVADSYDWLNNCTLVESNCSSISLCNFCSQRSAYSSWRSIRDVNYGKNSISKFNWKDNNNLSNNLHFRFDNL